MTRAYIGLGSNVGDRRRCLERAVAALRELGDVTCSSVYETQPIGPSEDLFLNAVVALDTTLAPRALFLALKQIESDLGRIPRERWGPREVDLDLVLYGDRTIDEPDLVVPHPELLNRAFVLVPLREIAPDAALPGGQILSGFLHDLDTDGVRLIGAFGGKNQDDAKPST